jgi:hypothetical protein
MMPTFTNRLVRGARVGLLALAIWVLPAGFAQAQIGWGGYGMGGAYGGYGYLGSYGGFGYGYPGAYAYGFPGSYGGFGYGYPAYSGYGYGYGPWFSGGYGYGYPWYGGASMPVSTPLGNSLLAGSGVFMTSVPYSPGVYPGAGYAPNDPRYENYVWYGPRYRVRTTYTTR